MHTTHIRAHSHTPAHTHTTHLHSHIHTHTTPFHTHHSRSHILCTNVTTHSHGHTTHTSLTPHTPRTHTHRSHPLTPRTLTSSLAMGAGEREAQPPPDGGPGALGRSRGWSSLLSRPQQRRPGRRPTSRHGEGGPSSFKSLFGESGRKRGRGRGWPGVTEPRDGGGGMCTPVPSHGPSGAPSPITGHLSASSGLTSAESHSFKAP